MSTICVLKTANVGTGLHQQSHERSGRSPTSLLEFLQAENRKLRNTVAQLQRDTMALREALQTPVAAGAER